MSQDAQQTNHGKQGDTPPTLPAYGDLELGPRTGLLPGVGNPVLIIRIRKPRFERYLLPIPVITIVAVILICLELFLLAALIPIKQLERTEQHLLELSKYEYWK